MRYGLSNSEVVLVEAAAIDLIGIARLTNRVSDYHEGPGESGYNMLMELDDDKDRITVDPIRQIDVKGRLVPSIELELPRSPEKIISQAIKNEAVTLSRRIDLGEITVTMAPDEVGPDSLAVLVSKFLRDPHFENISLEGLDDPQILFDAAVQGVSGLMVLSETAIDREMGKKINEFADLVTTETGALMTKAKKPSEFRKALSGVTKKTVSALSVLSFLLTACNADRIPDVTPDVTQMEPTVTEVIPTDTAAFTETSPPTETPTPTEAPVSPRPDFESMTEDERLQFMEEWGKYLADQVDCSPGTQALPTPTITPELLDVDHNMRVSTWRTEYLGSYQVPLNDKNNLPIGYVRCFYFASSDPGGIFTVWGGGEIWGEKMKSFLNDVDNGLDMNPGGEYEVSLPTEVLDRWSSTDATMKKLLIQEYYSHGDIMMVVAGRVRTNLESRLSSYNYPEANTRKLISNSKVPVAVVYMP